MIIRLKIVQGYSCYISFIYYHSIPFEWILSYQIVKVLKRDENCGIVAEDTPLATTARAEVGGRGRGGRRRKASGRVGGVVTRRARLNSNVTAPSDLASTDVYEFRDDSEEEARPRLILTIKSPPDPAVAAVAPAPTSAALTNVAPASPPSQTAPASTSNLAQPACRKSRRLQVSSY